LLSSSSFPSTGHIMPKTAAPWKPVDLNGGDRSFQVWVSRHSGLLQNLQNGRTRESPNACIIYRLLVGPLRHEAGFCCWAPANLAARGASEAGSSSFSS
jgi:hypothetical protein